jgi:hypothetical protein
MRKLSMKKIHLHFIRSKISSSKTLTFIPKTYLINVFITFSVKTLLNRYRFINSVVPNNKNYVKFRKCFVINFQKFIIKYFTKEYFSN